MTDNPNPELIKSDLARLDRMNDEDIDYSDIPELGDEFFSRAKRATFDETILNNPEAITQIAIRAFARAKDAAIRENDRLGIPSYGSKDGEIVVRLPPPPQAPDPWLQAMLDDVHERIRALMEARSEDEWARDEDLRFMRLVRELAEISTAMHDTKP